MAWSCFSYCQWRTTFLKSKALKVNMGALLALFSLEIVVRKLGRKGRGHYNLQRRAFRTGFGLCLPRPARESREGETAEQTREKGIAWLERVTHTVWRHEVVANTQEAKRAKKKKNDVVGSLCLLVNQRARECKRDTGLC